MVKRVLVIGLDSAPLDLITKWVREGRLPTIGGLINNGAAGILRSTFPPLSPTAWSSLGTGMYPGKHGIFDHVYRRPGTYQAGATNTRLRAGKAMWHIISENGGTVAVINVPETYPPQPVNGFLLTGMETPGDEADFCYPPELSQELQEAIGGYQVFGQMSKEDLDLAVTYFHQTACMRMRAAQYLWQRYQPQFMIVVLQETDNIQHRFWKYMDPDHPHYDRAGATRYGNAILELYQDIDQQMAELLAHVDDDTAVIIMSDHGAGPQLKFVHINNWLIQQGLMHIKGSLGARLKYSLFRMGLTPENALAFTAKLRVGLVDWGAKFVRRRRSSEEKSAFTPPLFLSFNDVDWTRTRAYAMGTLMNGISLNVKGREPQGVVERGVEYEALRREIAEKLLELVDEETGDRVVSEVYMREEIISGPYAERAPDVLFDCHNGRYVSNNAPEFRDNVLMKRSRMINGSHRIEGMIVLAGKPFQKGILLPDQHIVDMAPTILYLLGYKVPGDMDGQVMTAALLPEYLCDHPIRYTEESWISASDESGYTSEEEAAVTERLKGLGYM